MNILQKLKFVFSKKYANKILEEYFNEFVNELECNLCKIKFKGYSDKFRCYYCGSYYCTKHRLPEDHNCTGNPKSPNGSFIETHERGKITAYGK